MELPLIRGVTSTGFVKPTLFSSSNGLAVRTKSSIHVHFSDKQSSVKICFDCFRTVKYWPNAKIVVFVNDCFLGKIVCKDEGDFSSTFILKKSKFYNPITIKLEIEPRGLYKAILNIFEYIKGNKKKNLVRDSILIKKITVNSCTVFSCHEHNLVSSILNDNKVSQSVRIMGFFKQSFGLAEASRRTLSAIQSTEIPVKITQVPFFGKHNGNDSSISADTKKIGSNQNEIRIYHFNGDHLQNLIQTWGNETLDCNYKIGFWHWEQSVFPSNFQSWFYGLDEVWVPSEFISKTIIPKSTKPVQTIPLAYDQMALNMQRFDRSKFHIPEKKFVFLITFDFYSVIERKNPLGAIIAYKKLLSDHSTKSKIHLVLKTSNHHADSEGYQSLMKQINSIPMSCYTLITETLQRDEMLLLINSCDSLLSLHRSEGFGLHLSEALLMGKIVIATNWSGNTDFMTKKNSLLVDYSLVELEKDVGPYLKGVKWAEPSVEHAVSLMKEAVLNSKTNTIGQIRHNARQSVKNLHSPSRIGKIINDRLRLIEFNQTLEI